MSVGGLSTTPPREATVAAVRDYYALLTDMYLDPADVLSPPPPSGGDRDGGWPSSTIDRLECMGKTTSVLDLLRHLPYIRGEEDDGSQAGVPGCHFADWRHLAQTTSGDNENGPDGHSLRECSEPVELVKRDVIPPYVIGLTYGGRENPTFLLDTRRGIVHWYECPDVIRYTSPQAVTDVDDPFDWDDTSEEEAEWRAEHPAWSVADFFEILKKELLELRYVPVGSPSRVVLYSDDDDAEEELGELVTAIRAIYQRHGWPDRGSFDKEACLREVKRLVKEEYPDHDFLYDEEEDDEEEDEEEDDEEEEEDSEDDDEEWGAN